MSVASYESQSKRRRATGFLLALAVETLVIVALLLWRPGLFTKPPQQPRLTTFSVSPSPENRAANQAAARSPEHSKRPPADTPAPAQTQPTKPTPPKPPVPIPPVRITGLMPLDLGSSDIGAIKGSATGGSGNSGKGKDSTSTYGPGEGPGGMVLYNAEWYREPSDAELRTYIPAGGAPPGAWALIACRTVDHYHVENCQQLGESPIGSGLSRAMRQAAWQFLVRPPRINGKPQVGAWVKIRIDFTRARPPASGGSGPADGDAGDR